MQQFIPFEDNWDALDQLDPSQLIPYRLGLACERGANVQCTAPMSPSISSLSPAVAPIRCAVPAGSSST